MADVGKAYVQIVASADGITESITNALGGEANAAGQKAGQGMAGGIAATVGKTIAVLGVGKAISDSISNGMNYQTAMAKVSTLFQGTEEEFNALSGSLIGISNETGVAVSQLAEAAYSAESASVPMGNLGDMILNSAKLAKGGFTDIDTALSATAKTMNAYGMMSDDVAKTQANMEAVQRVLIQTQNKGITTVGELGASLAQVTPTAAAFGVSFDQVGAALAGMTAQGAPTAQATTQLNSMIAELGKDGTQAANKFRELTGYVKEGGLSFAEAMSMGWDLSDVLSIMDEGAADAGVSMVDMFSSIEAGKAAMSIWNSDWAGNMEAMATEADVVGEAYGTMSDTLAGKLEILKTKLANLGIGAFSLAVDGLTGFMDGLLTVIDNITPSLGDLGDSMGNFYDKIGPAMSEVLGLNTELSTTELISEGLKGLIDLLSGAFDFLAENADLVATAVALAAEAFIAYKANTTIAFLATHPVIAALVALVAAGMVLYKNWDKIKAKAEEIWGVIKEKFDGIKTSVSEAWQAVQDKTREVWNSLKNSVKQIAEDIRSSIATKWGIIKTTTTAAWNILKTSVTNAIDGAKTAVKNAIDLIKSTVSAAWATVRLNTSTAFNAVKTAISEGVSSAYQKVKSKFDSIKKKITDSINAAKDAVHNAIEAIKGFFNFEWSLPKLKLPHVTVSGSFSLMPPSAPKFGIEWYKKGALFDRPTVIGVGEAGAEAVVPLSGRQMMPFARAIASQMGGTGNTVNNYITVSGAENPEEFATRLARQIKLELRTVG